jgi:hypothetical protein
LGALAPANDTEFAMNDPARDALIDVLHEYGVSILDTPKSLATILRQHAKLVPHDVDALLAAAQNGVPTTIRNNPQFDPESLVRVLVLHAHMTSRRADWAVRTWIAALAQSQRPVESSPRGTTTAGAIFVVVGALAVGALVFLIFGR